MFLLGSLPAVHPQGAATTLASAPGLWAGFGPPSALSPDGSGGVYVASPTAHIVYYIDSIGTVTNFAGLVNSPGFSGNGGAASSARLSSPSDVALDSSSGVAYIADAGNACVRAVNAAGVITTAVGLCTVAGNTGDGSTTALLTSPMGLALFNSLLYILDAGPGRVRSWALSSGVVVAVVGGLSSPLGLRADQWGSLYITDAGGARIVRLPALSGALGLVAGSGALGAAGDGAPATSALIAAAAGGCAIDALGNVYFSDTVARRVRRVDVFNKNISSVIGSGVAAPWVEGVAALSAALSAPAGVAFSTSPSAGSAPPLLVADGEVLAVRSVAMPTPPLPLLYTMVGNGSVGACTGTIPPPALAENVALLNPVGVVYDGARFFYFGDSCFIRAWDTLTNVVSVVAGTGSSSTPSRLFAPRLATLAPLRGISDVTLDVSNNLLYFLDVARVGVINLTSKILTSFVAGNGTNIGSCLGDGVPATNATFNGANYFTRVNSTLYVTDNTFSAIRAIDTTTGLMSSRVACGSTLSLPKAVRAGRDGTLFVAGEWVCVLACVRVVVVFHARRLNHTLFLCSQGPKQNCDNCTWYWRNNVSDCHRRDWRSWF